MSGDGAVIGLRGPFGYVGVLKPRPVLARELGCRLASVPLGAQGALDAELVAQGPMALDVERLIYRFVAYAHPSIIRKVLLDPLGDLLGRPSACKHLQHVGPKRAFGIELARLGSLCLCLRIQLGAPWDRRVPAPA